MMTLFLTLLVLAVNPSQTHDHRHDDEGGAAMGEAAPPLTREQALAAVAEAWSANQRERRAALAAFDAAAQAALAAAPVEAQPGLQAIVNRVTAEAAALQAGRYVSALAPEDDELNAPLLAAAKEAGAARIHAADEAYMAALRAALARDPQGFIGAQFMQTYKSSVDTLQMQVLMDFYWHHGDLDDPPGSFERIIRLGYRFLELEPRRPEAGTVYADTAWLLWSRWVTWKQSGGKEPVGDGDDARALQLLLKGGELNPDDAAYHFDSGMTLWGLANYHDAKYWDFVVDSLKRAFTKAADKDLQVRAALTLGHACRKQNKVKEARQWYGKVLELEPGHEVAQRILNEDLAEPAGK